MDSLNQKIIDIIAKESIAGQQELLDRLKALGEDVTQSTLSRRLNKLRIAKRAGVYVTDDRPHSGGRALRSIEVAPPVFLVAHTLPGFANAIAAQLDACIPEKQEGRVSPARSNSLLQEIIGTIAGDDTVLIIAREGTALPVLKKEIERFLL